MSLIYYENSSEGYAHLVLPRPFLAGVLFGVVATVGVPASNINTQFLNQSMGSSSFVQVAFPEASSVADFQASAIVDRIRAIENNAELRDEDEAPPLPAVVRESVEIVKGAAALLSKAMLPGRVASFYGEINVTWLVGDAIVRLACFPSRPSIVQTGCTSGQLGSYRSTPNATSQMLADSLSALSESFA